MTGVSAVTRRRFLQFSGVVAARALMGGAGTVGLSQLLASDMQPSDSPVLVLVTLYGGNDGLNTVIPSGDQAYQDGRPDLAYRPQDALDLGDGLGLNPGMPRLYQLWNAGRLGIVRGVGYPKPDHSHFRSMAIWQTASPNTSVATGWIGRWLDATGERPGAGGLAGVDAAAVPCGGADGRLDDPSRGAEASHVCAGRGVPQARGGVSLTILRAAARAAGSVTDLYTIAAAVNHALSAPPTGTGALVAQLAAIGALIRAGVATRVYSTSLGGFDTHADERGTQQRLLGGLDAALGAFVDGLGAAGRRVVTVVYSEFGRRVKANASQGTDHGTAGAVFVLGDRVRGGFFGEQPRLTDLDNGDLKFTTDFRDVYASVLEEVLGADAEMVLGKWRGRVPLLD